jgi:hypothetical protein
LLQRSPVTVVLLVTREACRRGARRAWGVPPSAAAGANRAGAGGARSGFDASAMFPSSLRSLCMRTWPNEEGAEVLDALARAADGGMRLEHLEWSGIGCRTNFYMHFEPEALGAQQSLRSLTITVPVRPPDLVPERGLVPIPQLPVGVRLDQRQCVLQGCYLLLSCPVALATLLPSRSSAQPCLRAGRSVQGACSGRCGN